MTDLVQRNEAAEIFIKNVPNGGIDYDASSWDIRRIEEDKLTDHLREEVKSPMVWGFGRVLRLILDCFKIKMFLQC